MYIYDVNSLAIAAAILLCINASAITVDNVDDTCTYTFNVPRDGASCGLGAHAQDDDVEALKSLITSQHAILEQHLDTLTQQLGASKSVEDDRRGQNNSARSSFNTEVGTVYTQWGKKSCPDTAEMLYDGFAAKSSHDHGGGVNFLCLPRDPEHPAGATSGQQSKSYIYGTEYERYNSPLFDQRFDDNDVPCAVCEVSGRTRYLMIPAKQSCPPSWTKEYHGILMAQYYAHKGSDFLCIAEGFETLAGGSADQNGARLYVVEAKCGSLKCPPYEEGYEFACAVCTK